MSSLTLDRSYNSGAIRMLSLFINEETDRHVGGAMDLVSSAISAKLLVKAA